MIATVETIKALIRSKIDEKREQAAFEASRGTFDSEDDEVRALRHWSVVNLHNDGAVVKIDLEGQHSLESEYVLVAVGRRPNSDAISIDNAGVELDRRGFVKIGKRMETNISGIYAIGDVTGTPFLAHRSSEQVWIGSFMPL